MASTSVDLRVEQPSAALRQAVDRACRTFVRETIARKKPGRTRQPDGEKLPALRPQETREVFAEVVKLLGSRYRYKDQQNCLTQATILLTLYRCPAGFEIFSKYRTDVEETMAYCVALPEPGWYLWIASNLNQLKHRGLVEQGLHRKIAAPGIEQVAKAIRAVRSKKK